MRRLAPAPLVLLLAAACASGGAAASSGAPAGTVVEPSEKNITDRLDTGEDSRSPRVLWVTNRSSLPIVVTSVTLANCENVPVACGPVALAVRVGPGERRQVLRLQPASETSTMRFDYTFAWKRADTP